MCLNLIESGVKPHVFIDPDFVPGPVLSPVGKVRLRELRGLSKVTQHIRIREGLELDLCEDRA